MMTNPQQHIDNNHRKKSSTFSAHGDIHSVSFHIFKERTPIVIRPMGKRKAKASWIDMFDNGPRPYKMEKIY